MERKLLIIPVLVICILTMLGCNAQTTNRTKSDKPPSVEKPITETEDCWKEFKDSTANVSVKFCGEPQESILNDTLNGENIKRTSHLVLDSKANGNARYFLVWFDWKLKNNDENSLRKFYDEFIKDRLKRGSGGSLKDSKEVILNGKIGREFTSRRRFEFDYTAYILHERQGDNYGIYAR